MSKSELLKRSLEKGTAIIDMTRERAELLVKELVDAGVVRKGQAEKAIDVVVERSRKRSETFAKVIRDEIAEQLSAFGVATKDDIARLESKLGAPGRSSGGRPASRVKSPARGTKAAPITKSAKTTTPKNAVAGDMPAMKPAGGHAGRGADSSGAR